MTKRTHQEMAQSLNDLSRGQFYVEQSGIEELNLYWFSLSTKDILHFTPYDSDQTLVLGLQNHELIRT